MRSDQLLAHDIFASIDQTLAKVIGIISIKVKHKMQIFLGVAVIAIFLQFSPGETAFHNCTRPGLVALTFDDGPSFPETNSVLDVLNTFGVKATFFINGLYNYESDLDRYKRTIRRIYDEGHQLGSHSWTHVNLTGIPDSELIYELEHLAEVVRSILEVNLTLWRPPLGEFTPQMEYLVRAQFGYELALWNVDTRDWATPSVGVDAYREFYNHYNATDTKLSSVGLHHDTLAGSDNLTHSTLTYVVHELGLRPVTLAECLELGEMYVPAVNGGKRHQNQELHFLFTLGYLALKTLFVR